MCLVFELQVTMRCSLKTFDKFLRLLHYHRVIAKEFGFGYFEICSLANICFGGADKVMTTMFY